MLENLDDSQYAASSGRVRSAANRKKYRAMRSTPSEQCDNISDRTAEKALKCYFCGDWIYAGDDYYSLDNIDCCEDCLNLHYRQTAEPIDYQAELADLECSEIRE